MSTTTLTRPARPAPRRHIGPVRAIRHSLTLAWRATMKIRHNPEQLLDVSLQPIVFVTLFVFLFGGAIQGGDRHAYLEFLMPGIAVQTVLFASMGTGINLNTDITKGIFDRFRSLPIARSAPLTGLILGDVIRFVISLTVMFGYGAVLGFRFHTGLPQVIAGFALIMAFALALCWITALAGLLVKTPQSLQGFGFVVLFPLTFGSNVFVTAQTLPGWLQAWVKVNPVTSLVESARGLMLGPAALPPGHPLSGAILASLAWTAGIVLVFAPLAVGVYRRKT